MSHLKLVFCGPTISHQDAMQELEAVYLPPAVQGSIVSAVTHFKPSIIILIDGGFQTEPAIKHKEILWAISRGITVVGASSIGALRAAELSPFMIGVGLIYRWYHRFKLAPDDAVAVQHGPEEVNFCPLTDALIDMRMTFRLAWRSRSISWELAKKLEHTAICLNFRDRTLLRVVNDTLPGAKNLEREACYAILSSLYVRQKRSDAVTALRLVASGNLQIPPSPPDFVVTRALVNDLIDSGVDPHWLGDEQIMQPFT